MATLGKTMKTLRKSKFSSKIGEPEDLAKNTDAKSKADLEKALDLEKAVGLKRVSVDGIPVQPNEDIKLRKNRYPIRSINAMRGKLGAF